MKIFDISQEVFGCVVFPGDPAPKRETLLNIEKGDICNLTAFSMCAHNGTHVDAPFHFYKDGKTLDQVSLERFIGWAYVAEHEGEITAEDAIAILERARNRFRFPSAAKRILIKGKAVLTLEAAKIFSQSGIVLYGNESQTVGPEEAPRDVHLVLLGAEIVLLEGIRLKDVCEGVYILNAAPINLGGADGAPCRAVLIEMEEKI